MRLITLLLFYLISIVPIYCQGTQEVSADSYKVTLGPYVDTCQGFIRYRQISETPVTTCYYLNQYISLSSNGIIITLDSNFNLQENFFSRKTNEHDFDKLTTRNDTLFAISQGKYFYLDLSDTLWKPYREFLEFSLFNIIFEDNANIFSSIVIGEGQGMLLIYEKESGITRFFIPYLGIPKQVLPFQNRYLVATQNYSFGGWSNNGATYELKQLQLLPSINRDTIIDRINEFYRTNFMDFQWRSNSSLFQDSIIGFIEFTKYSDLLLDYIQFGEDINPSKLKDYVSENTYKQELTLLRSLGFASSTLFYPRKLLFSYFDGFAIIDEYGRHNIQFESLPQELSESYYLNGHDTMYFDKIGKTSIYEDSHGYDSAYSLKYKFHNGGKIKAIGTFSPEKGFSYNIYFSKGFIWRKLEFPMMNEEIVEFCMTLDNRDFIKFEHAGLIELTDISLFTKLFYKKN